MVVKLWILVHTPPKKPGSREPRVSSPVYVTLDQRTKMAWAKQFVDQSFVYSIKEVEVII